MLLAEIVEILKH